MSDYREYIAGIEGVATGKTGTANLPVGRRYLRLKIMATATLIAGGAAVNGKDVLDDIILTATTARGNVELLNLPAADFVKDAKINGLNPAAKEVPIHFAEPKRATVIEEVATAFDTYDLVKATLKFKVKATVENVDIVILAIYDFGSLIETVDSKPMRKIAFIKKFKMNYAVGAGKVPITSIPKEYPLLRLYLDGAQNITAAEVKVDSIPRHEATLADNNTVLADYGFVTGEYKYQIVFDETQRLTGALSIVKELVVSPTSAAAQNVDVIVHQLVPAYV